MRGWQRSEIGAQGEKRECEWARWDSRSWKGRTLLGEEEDDDPANGFGE